MRVVVVPVVQREGVVAGGGLEVGPLALDFGVAGVGVGAGVRHQDLSVGPEFEGAEVGLGVPHSALGGLDGHYYAGGIPSAAEAVESAFRVSGGLVVGVGNADVLQQFGVGEVIPAAGVAEAGVGSVGVAVVQVIPCHLDQPVEAFLR